MEVTMRPLLASTLPALLLISLASACSPGRSGDGDSSAGPDNPGTTGTPPGAMNTLSITPKDLVLRVDQKSGATQTYRVTRDGQDVTAQATLYLDNPRLGSFKGALFTANPGTAGKGNVQAKLGADWGTTTLTLKLAAVIIGKGAPADAPLRFMGAPDPNNAPELAYPPDGALVPPNLNELEFQFHPRQATLFEVHLSGEVLDLRIYTPCVTAGSGCGLLPDEDTWKLLSQAERGHTVAVSVRGTSDKGGVGTSAPQALSFGDDDILGGLYYWAASAGGIFRYDFGRRGQKAENFYSPGLAGLVTCVGCHALSRNGKRIAVGLNIPGPAQMRALEVATRNKLFEVGNGIPILGGSDYESFTADGELLVTTEKGGLTIRKADGTVVGSTPQVANADMPDVAPDGSQVVFARGAGTCVLGLCVTLSVQSAGLYTVPFKGDSFGDPKELVPAGGANNYYPAFSPDGRFVVFNRSGGDSYDAADARVMIVPAAGGDPIDLKSVNEPVGNSWPKWGPFVQHFKGATILWLTFSSRRDYGLRHLGNSQLWMVPVDVARLQKGMDPGYPPIWMPFQDMGTGNHIAQWVETVQRAPCSDVEHSGCMPNEMCVDGMCVPGVQ